MNPNEFLQLVQNVEPSLRPEMERVFTPHGTGPVATSPHFVYIVCNLLRGYGPREVSEMVEREKKAFISIDALRDYTLQYVPPHLNLNNLKHRWLQRMDSMDEIGLLESLAKIQMMRVMERLDRPSVDAEDDESKRRDIDCLRKLAMDSLKAKIETGRYVKPVTEVRHTHTVDGEVVHTHDHLPSSIEPRDASAVLRALEAIKSLSVRDPGDGQVH